MRFYLPLPSLSRKIVTSLLLSCAALLLSACEQGYNGNVGGASVPAKNFGKLNVQGRNHYNAMCANCHGATGNGTEVGTPLIACATCTDVGTLAEEIARTMPVANVEACEGSCALDTADYIMFAFNGEILANAQTSLQGVSAEPLNLTLRRSMVQFSDRLPTVAENEAVKSQGVAAFNATLESVFAEESFYQRLMEIYNEQLLTDKYLNKNSGGAIDLLDGDDFTSLRWYEQPPHEDKTESCLRGVTNDSIAREPLQLVKYLAKNNLPFNQLLTADYIMVNWYSQQSYGAELVDSSASFKTLDAAVCSNSGVEVFHDPNDFKPAKILHDTEYNQGGIPHAGVLTSAMFLNRYPTTNTNRNRHRSKVTYDYFLDTDILKIEGSRPDQSIDITTPTPTLDNKACYSCHLVMDPIASAYQHWTDRGRFILSSSSHNNWDASGIEAPGLAGKKIPLSGPNSQNGSMLQWLGKQMAEDPRFIRATMRTLYKGLIGQDLLPAPGDSASDAEKTAFNAQRGVLNTIGQAMVADNWNIKTAIKGLLLSPYYRAATIDETQVVANQHIGGTQFLSPELMQRKLYNIFGFGWDAFTNKNNRTMMGGMDSDSITSRISEPNGLMVAIQQRMATIMACRGTAFDFTRARTPENNQRKLFPFVSVDTLPEDGDGFPLVSNVENIKKNIQYLHWAILAEEVKLDSAEVTASFNLFLEVWRKGNELVASSDDVPNITTGLSCNAYYIRNKDGVASGSSILESSQRISQDPDYTIRAWMAVVTYLISDYRFVYE